MRHRIDCLENEVIGLTRLYYPNETTLLYCVGIDA